MSDPMAPAPQPAADPPEALVRNFPASTPACARDAVLAGQAVAANLWHDPPLCRWAREAERLVRVDRKPWKCPLHTPHDGPPDAVARWYVEFYLPFKPSLRRRLRGLRGKVLAYDGPHAGAHAAALAELVNGLQDDRGTGR